MRIPSKQLPIFWKFALSLIALVSVSAWLFGPPERDAGVPASTQSLRVLNYTRNQALEARRHFAVEVLWLDKENIYGTPGTVQANMARVRVTNNSAIVLPELTVLTTRWAVDGKYLGSSRAPRLPTANLKPGESVEFNYYSLGALPGTDKLTVEVEQMLNPVDEQFVTELPKK